MNRARQGLLGALFVRLLACGGPRPDDRAVTVVLPGAGPDAAIRETTGDEATPPEEARVQGPAAPIVFRPWSLAIEEEARRAKKPLLVFVRADWAAPSTRIERDYFTDPSIQRIASAFIPIVIDGTDASARGIDELLVRFEIRSVPCVEVVRIEGTAAAPILRIPAQDRGEPGCIVVDGDRARFAAALEAELR